VPLSKRKEIADDSDQAWREAMQMKFVEEAKRISHQIASEEKSGFGSTSAPKSEGMEAVEGFRSQVEGLVTGDLSLIGNLVVKKERALIEAIARTRNEELFE
jgi:hypothetical protein